VNDLLNVSRITRGKIELRCVRLDAATALESACESVAPQIAARSHTLLADFRPGELWLDADPTRLEQIAVNLLANAAKYTEPQGRIWLTARREGSDIVIIVRDTGIGIEPQKIPEMFELFTQGERSAARIEGGLGIGLTVVRRLCELHGGSISAHSAGPGQGSTFTVRLPAATPPAQVVAPATNGHTPTATVKPGGRILIVDDIADTANGLARLLTRRGYSTELAHDGPAALAKARTFSPAAVLLDIGLPGMDGFEVARRLRAAPEGTDVLIVALSGYGQEEDRVRSREAGFDHHLVKPVDFEELRALLASRLTAG
jgi:CheY-like chemotaxis protein